MSVDRWLICGFISFKTWPSQLWTDQRHHQPRADHRTLPGQHRSFNLSTVCLHVFTKLKIRVHNSILHMCFISTNACMAHLFMTYLLLLLPQYGSNKILCMGFGVLLRSTWVPNHHMLILSTTSQDLFIDTTFIYAFMCEKVFSKVSVMLLRSTCSTNNQVIYTDGNVMTFLWCVVGGRDSE